MADEQVTESQRKADAAEKERTRFRKRAADALRQAVHGTGPPERESPKETDT